MLLEGCTTTGITFGNPTEAFHKGDWSNCTRLTENGCFTEEKPLSTGAMGSSAFHAMDFPDMGSAILGMHTWSKFVDSQSNVGARYKSMMPSRLPIPTTTTYLTIPPGISPTTFLESPVLLNTQQADPSQRTGSLWNSCISDTGYQPSDDHTVPKMEFKCEETTGFLCASLELRESMDSSAHRAEPLENSLVSYVPDLGCASSCLVERSSVDGYNWKKYGQKQLKGMMYPRSYYKCTHPDCPVRKQVESSSEGEITEILYKGDHIHPKPQGVRRGAQNYVNGWKTATGTLLPAPEKTAEGSIGVGRMDVDGFSQEGTPELSFGSRSNEEGEDSEGRKAEGENEDEHDPKRRRISIDGETISNAPFRTVREPRVVVQTVSEVDILDDGYRWRKYGQKVVKGKQFPRSYYKCTNMGCAVRKNVERCSSDPKSVVTAYEGKHNHDVPMARGGVRETDTTTLGGGGPLATLPIAGRVSVPLALRPPLPWLESVELGAFVGASSNGEDGVPIALSGTCSSHSDNNVNRQPTWFPPGRSTLPKNWDD